MGCGTGILAILAAKMGAAPPVCAVDIDPVAVDSARENSRRNRLSKRVIPIEGDSSSIAKGCFDLILANINRNIILKDMRLYAAGLTHSGELILSGFYVEDSPVIIEEAGRYGLELIAKGEKEGWAVLKFGINKYF